MDAIALTLPATAIASSGSNGADTNAFDPAGDAATADFATLLAAGLAPQPVVADGLPVPAASVRASDAAGEPKDDVAPKSADTAALAMLAIPPHAPALAATADTTKGGTAVDTRSEAGAVSMTSARGKPGADIAAEAASVAGAKPGLAPLVEHDHRRLDPADAADSAHGAAIESSAAPIHLPHAPAAAAVSSAAQPGAILQVAAPLAGPDFAPALSQQVVWMANKDAQIAELRINPPELGPVEVRLHISGDEAVVQFASAHAEVRSAIEASLARLRESMAQAGIQLGDASVGAESFREQAASQSGGAARGTHGNGVERAESAWTATPIAAGVRRGLVDLFA